MNTTKQVEYRVPIGVSGAALLLWGFGTDHLVLGVILAAGIEGQRIVRSRWAIDDHLLSRTWTLCTVLFLVSLVIGLIREGVARAGYSAIEWQPVTMLPIALAQVYGTRAGIPTRILSAMSRFLQRGEQKAGVSVDSGKIINIEYPYVCAVLIATGIPTPKGPLFYIGAAALVVLGLFLNRARPRVRPGSWLVMVLFVAVTGYVAHIGLHGLHVHLENTVVGLNVSGQNSSAERAMTRIGSVGELKLSTKINWWLKVVRGRRPGYLRTAAFDVYRRETWFTVKGRALIPAARKADTDDWVLSSEADGSAHSMLALSGRSHGEETHLALPAKPLELLGLRAESIHRRRTGLTVAEGTPGVLDFRALYIAGANTDLRPSDRDLEVTPELSRGLRRVISDLKLANARPRAVANGLTAFFRDEFDYSVFLDIGKDDHRESRDPILRFLEENRKGHCEYFATATALLLRVAGVPARYVTGYCVSEYDKRRARYIIRGLHAHAWVQAWIDGRWEYIDTTPSGWLSVENEALPYWQPLSDWLAGLPVALAVWANGPVGRIGVKCFRWGGLPVLGLYLWFRLFRGQRTRRILKRGRGSGVVLPGMQSPWYDLEPRLVEAVGYRGAGEPLRLWWDRVRTKCSEPLASNVSLAITLHYRLRFDELAETGVEGHELNLDPAVDRGAEAQPLGPQRVTDGAQRTTWVRLRPSVTRSEPSCCGSASTSTAGSRLERVVQTCQDLIDELFAV